MVNSQDKENPSGSQTLDDLMRKKLQKLSEQEKPPSLEELRDILTSSLTQKFQSRSGRSRGNTGKHNRQDPSNTCLPWVPCEIDIPLRVSRIRVGIGGDRLVVQLLGDPHVVELNNIADGEWLELEVVRILDTDCKNIVVFN